MMHIGKKILSAALLAGVVACSAEDAAIRILSDWDIYHVSERCELTVTPDFRNLPPVPLTAKWLMSDIGKKSVASGEFRLDGKTPEARVPLKIVLPGRGWYRFDLELVDGRGAGRGKKTSSFASVEFHPDTGFRDDGFWGLNGHTNRDHFAFFRKIGCTIWRLDIPWRDIESSAGQWRWTLYDRVTDESRKHGMHLLAVLGKNPRHLKLPEGQGTDRKRFLDYVERTVLRYRDRIRFWDLWNEPQYSWNGSKEEFGTVMNDAYKVIKRLQPDSVVVFNGHPFEEELRGYTLENLKHLNGELPFDVIGMHPYNRPKSPDSNHFLRHMRNIGNSMKKFAPGKKLWISELGWPTSTDALGVTELEQAAYLQRAALMGLAAGAEKFIWYQPFSGHDLKYSEAQYGITRADRTPKISLAAYAWITRALDGLNYAGEVRIGSAVRCLRFAGKDRELLVLWATEEPVVLEKPELPKGTEMFRGDGSALSPENGNLPVGILPVFLFSSDGTSVGKALTGARLLLKNPVALETAALLADGVRLRVRNRTGKKLPTEFLLTLPEGMAFRNPKYRGRNPVVLNTVLENIPKELHLKLDYPKTDWSGKIGVEIRTPGTARKTDIPLRLFAVPGKNVVLDSIFDIGPADMQKEWKGKEDLSINTRFDWNSRGLLIFASVLDSVHRNDNAQSTIWGGDSIQIAADTSPLLVPSHYDIHSVELCAALTKNGIRKAVYSGGNGESFGADIRRSEERKITEYRLLLPWKLLGYKRTPPEGTVFSLSFLVNDCDGGSRKWMQLSPGIGIEKNPALYPRFILVK